MWCDVCRYCFSFRRIKSCLWFLKKKSVLRKVISEERVGSAKEKVGSCQRAISPPDLFTFPPRYNASVWRYPPYDPFPPRLIFLFPFSFFLPPPPHVIRHRSAHLYKSLLLPSEPACSFLSSPYNPNPSMVAYPVPAQNLFSFLCWSILFTESLPYFFIFYHFILFSAVHSIRVTGSVHFSPSLPS